MTGFVTFLSAGPGDPDLLTLKAARLLSKAEVLLYDDLSTGPLLHLAPAHAELVSVGKRAGRPSPKQDHINRLLVDYAKAGHHVIRLKSGDAGIFGRLDEELTALRAAAIPYEIVPGVTASSAAAAVCGIPLTRRETARRFQMITGHGTNGALPEGLNWAALCDPDAVTAVYMARATAALLCQSLVDHGMDGDTEALIVIAASQPTQKICRCTLATVSSAICRLENDLGPFLLVYGALPPSGDFDFRSANPTHADIGCEIAERAMTEG